MGTKVRLSVACGDYEIVRALLAEGELPAMINPYIPKPIVSGDQPGQSFRESQTNGVSADGKPEDCPPRLVQRGMG